MNQTDTGAAKPAAITGQLASLAMNKDGFAFNPSTGDSFTVNATGQAVVEKLVAGMDSSTVAGWLSSHYGIPLDHAEQDVAAFVDRLIRLGLVD